MSYLLFLGFDTILYKVNPIARIYINNYFIDEFCVNKNISFKNKKSSIPLLYPKNNTYNSKIGFCKCFEIDKKLLFDSKINELCIEIFNNDNNYTNGFLSKSTEVFLSYVFCIQKKDLLNYEKIIIQRQQFKNSLNNTKNIVDWYTRPKYFLFDLFKHPRTFNFYKDKFFWLHQEKKINPENTEFVGGSGKFVILFNKNVTSYEKSNCSSVVPDWNANGVCTEKGKVV